MNSSDESQIIMITNKLLYRSGQLGLSDMETAIVHERLGSNVHLTYDVLEARLSYRAGTLRNASSVLHQKLSEAFSPYTKGAKVTARNIASVINYGYKSFLKEEEDLKNNRATSISDMRGIFTSGDEMDYEISDLIDLALDHITRGGLPNEEEELLKNILFKVRYLLDNS